MDWAKVLRSNEKKVKTEMRKAHWDALTNQHLRFIVNMDGSGYVWTMTDVAGGNAFSAAVFNGGAIEIVSYCFQYWDDCNSPMEQKAFKETLDDEFEDIVKFIKESGYYNAE